ACSSGAGRRLSGRQHKFVLKSAMRGILPDATLDRKKQGFAMPIGRWLAGELRGWMESELEASRIGDLFQPAVIRRLMDEHTSGRAAHRKPLWTPLAFRQSASARLAAGVEK